MARQHLGVSAERRKRQYDMRTRPCEFPVGTWVWCLVPRFRPGRYRKWQSPYHGPFLVVKQLGPLNYVIQRSARSKPWTVHVDKLKECVSPGMTSWLGSENLPRQPDVQPNDTSADSQDQETPESTQNSPRPRRQIRPPIRYRQ